MRQFLVTLLLFSAAQIFSQQTPCESRFVQDTMSDPTNNKVLEGSYIEGTLKDGTMLRFFVTEDHRCFLRLIVTRSFYFDKVDVLEVRSGSKSYYVKNTRQFKVSKTAGLYQFEIFKNYVGTLKEDGITSIYFANAETEFSKQDAALVKEIAKCVYNLLPSK